MGGRVESQAQPTIVRTHRPNEGHPPTDPRGAMTRPTWLAGWLAAKGLMGSEASVVWICCIARPAPGLLTPASSGSHKTCASQAARDDWTGWGTEGFLGR